MVSDDVLPAQTPEGTGARAVAQLLKKTPAENTQYGIAEMKASLRFDQMDIRRETIMREHSHTCEWLFDQPEYLSWRDPDLAHQNHGFLWIKAKPGAGKSTLMKYLTNSAHKRLPDDTTISFFFHAWGELLQRSSKGMYRSLLHQMLVAFPRLEGNLQASWASLKPAAQQDWCLDSLRPLFYQAVLGLGSDRITCFIDALDECPEDEVRELVQTLGDLSHSAISDGINLRICFSSRHYPTITVKKCQHLNIDGQWGHRKDIARYIETHLVGEGKTMKDVGTEVQARAQGIFLWAVLVVKMLNKEHDRGANALQLRRSLNEIPDGLHELFRDILERNTKDEDDNEHLLHILQWVMYAQRPLSPQELYFAILSGMSDPNALQSWNPAEIELRTIHVFILNHSKGLTEVVQDRQARRSIVQFIHESVRDYLREVRFRAHSPSVGVTSEVLAHDYLKRCCNFLLAFDPLQQNPVLKDLVVSESVSGDLIASKHFPFLRYSGSGILHHADMAHGRSISQSRFLEEFPVHAWVRTNAFFEDYDDDSWRLSRSPSYSEPRKWKCEFAVACGKDQDSILLLRLANDKVCRLFLLSAGETHLDLPCDTDYNAFATAATQAYREIHQIAFNGDQQHLISINNNLLEMEKNPNLSTRDHKLIVDIASRFFQCRL
ncbi:hypothetical protein Q7P37_007565 [Cladosporium fusiforme]